MAETSNIEWTDATFNPWIGCTKVSPGCDHCYAERSTPSRTLSIVWGPGQPRKRTSAGNWKLPEQWNRAAAGFQLEHGRRRRVFCASLADVFDNEVPTEWRVDLFRLIAATPNLDWLILTKRIGNVTRMLAEVAERCCGGAQPLPNVWLGISVVNQEEANRDIPKLLAIDAAKRWLSMEPLLGPVDLKWQLTDPTGDFRTHGGKKQMKLKYHGKLHWVVVGGESGMVSRPMHVQWARQLRDQCAAAGVPYLFKQWGEYSVHEVDARGTVTPPMSMNLAGILEWRDDLGTFHLPAADAMAGEVLKKGAVLALPIGKKHSGRVLDGALHDGYPT